MPSVGWAMLLPKPVIERTSGTIRCSRDSTRGRTLLFLRGRLPPFWEEARADVFPTGRSQLCNIAELLKLGEQRETAATAPLFNSGNSATTVLGIGETLTSCCLTAARSLIAPERWPQ